MDNVTLIATFYNTKPFLPAALKFSPKKIVLLVDSADKEVKDNIKAVKKTFEEVVQFEVVNVGKDDIYTAAKTTVQIIDANKAPGNKIIVSIAGGNRVLASAALFGAYARPDRVSKIVANATQDSASLVSLPKLSYNIGSTKRELLAKLESRNDKTIQEIASEMRKSRGMIYQHLKELKNVGYLDDDYNITDAGKLALL